MRIQFVLLPAAARRTEINYCDETTPLLAALQVYIDGNPIIPYPATASLVDIAVQLAYWLANYQYDESPFRVRSRDGAFGLTLQRRGAEHLKIAPLIGGTTGRSARVELGALISGVQRFIREVASLIRSHSPGLIVCGDLSPVFALSPIVRDRAAVQITADAKHTRQGLTLADQARLARPRLAEPVGSMSRPSEYETKLGRALGHALRGRHREALNELTESATGSQLTSFPLLAADLAIGSGAPEKAAELLRSVDAAFAPDAHLLSAKAELHSRQPHYDRVLEWIHGAERQESPPNTLPGALGGWLETNWISQLDSTPYMLHFVTSIRAAFVNSTTLIEESGL